MFFFEKKNQKTFSIAPTTRLIVNPRARHQEQKFFASFFQKKNALLMHREHKKAGEGSPALFVQVYFSVK
jgi:hypothetical protein